MTNPNTGTVVNNTGNELARASDNNWTVALNYLGDLANDSTLEFNVAVSGTGDYHHEPSNDPRSFQDGYSTYDAYIRYTSGDDRWDLTAWGKNLNDELYITHMITSTFGGAVEINAPPRNYGLTFNYYMR